MAKQLQTMKDFLNALQNPQLHNKLLKEL